MTDTLDPAYESRRICDTAHLEGDRFDRATLEAEIEQALAAYTAYTAEMRAALPAEVAGMVGRLLALVGTHLSRNTRGPVEYENVFDPLRQEAATLITAMAEREKRLVGLLESAQSMVHAAHHAEYHRTDHNDMQARPFEEQVQDWLARITAESGGKGES